MEIISRTDFPVVDCTAFPILPRIFETWSRISSSDLPSDRLNQSLNRAISYEWRSLIKRRRSKAPSASSCLSPKPAILATRMNWRSCWLSCTKIRTKASTFISQGFCSSSLIPARQENSRMCANRMCIDERSKRARRQISRAFSDDRPKVVVRLELIRKSSCTNSSTLTSRRCGLLLAVAVAARLGCERAWDPRYVNPGERL